MPNTPCATLSMAMRSSEVCTHAEDLIAILPDAQSILCREVHQNIISDLRDAFDKRLYLLITRHREADEPRREQQLRDRATHFDIPLVAGTEVLYHHRERRDLQDVMTCIRHGVTLATAGRHTRANAEHALRNAQYLRTLFADDLYAVNRTIEVAERCTFTLAEIHYPLSQRAAARWQ